MPGRPTFLRLAVALGLLATCSALFARHSSFVGVRIDPARAWVGLARVHLEVSDLWVAEGALVGRYDIRVPMLPSRNDTGTIRLELPVSLDRLQQDGGQLSGSAKSAEDGTTRVVTCEIASGGEIEIHIAMPDRTIEFRSRYHPLEPEQAARL